MADGKLNEQVAADLGISEVMVKVHRAHGMRKMQVMSLVQLVRVIDHLTNNGETGRSSIQDSNYVAAQRNVASRPPDHAEPTELSRHRRTGTKH